tara:strand:- start:972 stop:2627 length:1656 start_codon:yes stop_codon:yes gene_type:complete
MATVTVNVQAQTGEATKDINNLDAALDGANKSAEELTDSLEGQEKRIKTLSGAINIVGGSVELLAGSLALSGVLTEEQTQKFEGAALGAIAFADGTKRVFEGYKELSEASKLATKAQVANNAAVLANPYVAAAAAVVALSAAIFILIKRNKTVITEEQRRAGALDTINKETEEAERIQKQYNRSLEVEQNRANNSIELLKARGASIEEIFQAEKNLLQVRIQAQKFDILPELERQNTELEKAVRALEAQKKSTNGVIAGQEEIVTALETSRDALKDQVIELDNLNTELLLLETNYENARRGLEDNPIDIKLRVVTPTGEETTETLGEYFSRQTGEIQGATVLAQTSIQSIGDETTKSTTKAYANSALAFQAFLINTNDSLNDFFEGSTGEAIGSTLEAASTLTSALVQVTDDGTKEGFEKSKKFKIAEVVTSSTQAAFQAFAAAQQFGPILGPILGAAQVAAIAVAGNRAIQDIRSSSFDSGNISGGGGGGGAVNIPGGVGAGLGGSSQTLVTNIPTPEPGPMRAYVVTGDVTNGQEAEAQLERRRTFGPG